MITDIYIATFFGLTLFVDHALCYGGQDADRCLFVSKSGVRSTQKRGYYFDVAGA